MADFRKLPLKQFAKTQEGETPEGTHFQHIARPRLRITYSLCARAAKFWRRFEPRVLEKYVRDMRCRAGAC